MIESQVRRSKQMQMPPTHHKDTLRIQRPYVAAFLQGRGEAGLWRMCSGLEPGGRPLEPCPFWKNKEPRRQQWTTLLLWNSNGGAWTLLPAEVCSRLIAKTCFPSQTNSRNISNLCFPWGGTYLANERNNEEFKCGSFLEPLRRCVPWCSVGWNAGKV